MVGSCRERFKKVLDMMFREEGISRWNKSSTNTWFWLYRSKKKVPLRPSQTRTLSNLVPFNRLWQLFSRKLQPQHPMVQNLRFQHPNLPQRIITWGILQLRQTMTGFRWLNQELQLLLRHNCDGLRELVLHVHRCPKLAKAAKHLGQLCPPCSFPHQRVNANTAH